MTIGIIPARYGSTRFEGKPLALIAGKPMIQRVYESAKISSALNDVYVATDDQRIFETVERFGGRALMTSNQCRSGTDRVAEAAKILGIKPNDIVVNIQGDQPLFSFKIINELVSPFYTYSDSINITTLAFKMESQKEISDPQNVKVTFDVNGFALYFSRANIPFPRDQKELSVTPFYKHLGFYAYRSSFLDKIASLPTGLCERIEKLEQLRVIEHGFSIKVVITRFDSPEIDLPEDIKKIEANQLCS